MNSQRLAEIQYTENHLFPVWRESVNRAIGVIDEKGRCIPENSHALWDKDWYYMRQLLLDVVDSIDMHTPPAIATG